MPNLPKINIHLRKLTLTLWSLLGLYSINIAQNRPSNQFANDKFEQLGPQLPTPNTTRTASGAPGRDYWQQRADYDIKVELDDATQILTGSETVTYFNNSPDALPFIWLQLDQNIFKKGAARSVLKTGDLQPTMTMATMKAVSDMGYGEQGTGYQILGVKDKLGKPLVYAINNTMMRVELPTPLAAGQTFVFSVNWKFKIIEFANGGRRTGYEHFDADNNNIYEMAQFFPRMCVYDDVNGWQNKQYIEQGEFALAFGNYKVAITVPADHVLGATGELQNTAQILTPAQLKRWEAAKTASTPVEIVTQAEAENAEKQKSDQKKTWVFKAENVRDFAFATSRKYIWDAMAISQAGRQVMCMSFYPKEGNPLWGKYSTRAVAHTIKSYSATTIDYPYPTAISCNGPVGGMEYPMICFNGPRPETDGTYSEATKYGLISVIIHEVGHNFFPMIINNDERQWMWMDEGLNTFCQYLAEKEWDYNYPSRRGEAKYITDYMKSDPNTLVPIMTTSDLLISAGNSAYAKPATALNILRETIMGRELFDYAFKEYARRWAFKHPSPADFFRTMEDASGMDLDWFWKGWFYGKQPVDQSLGEVEWFQVNTQNPEIEKPIAQAEANRKAKTLSALRDEKTNTVVNNDPTMKDFYDTYDPNKVTKADREKYASYLASLSPEEKNLVEANANFYVLNISNQKDNVMPVIIKMQFEDGTDSVARFPAEIWRFNNKMVKKVISTPKKVVQWTLDPFFEIADINTDDNSFPRVQTPTRFQLFKQQGSPFGTRGPNPMQLQRTATQPAQQGGGGGRN